MSSKRKARPAREPQSVAAICLTEGAELVLTWSDWTVGAGPCDDDSDDADFMRREDEDDDARVFC